MKLKILSLIFLFTAINVFAQDIQPPVQDVQRQKQEEKQKIEQEKLLKKQQKEQKQQEKEKKKTEEKQKQELEKKQKAEQNQEEIKKKEEGEQKQGSEKKQKTEQKKLTRQEEIKKKEEGEQKQGSEKKQKTEQKKLARQEEIKKKEEEKLKQESEKKQKIEQEELKRQEEEKKILEEQEKEKAEKQQAKDKRKQEKEDKARQKLKKRSEVQARKTEREPSSSLIFDYDLKFRAASYSNLDYTANKVKSENIFQQYLSIDVKGKFDDRIEMAAKLASYGISGKRSDIFAMPYSDDDFTVYLENAYLNFRSDIDAFIPYMFTFGKQHFKAGDGLIIDANQNGFLGARVKADLSHLFSIDAFAGKVDNQDFSIYGGSIKVKLAPVIEVGIYQERNDMGFAYQKGVFVDSDTYAIQSDIKTFYDIRLTGGNQKYKYRLEAAQQTGELVKISTDTVEYDAFAFVAEGSWKGTLLKKESNAKIVFSYADAKDDNAFNPTFSKRYDGLQRVGYGTLFAVGGGDSFLIIPQGYGGINTIGVSFDMLPWSFLQTGMGFYLYSASDAPSDAGDAGLSKLYGAKADLGNEFDFFVKYKYLNYFDIGFAFAMYTPPSTGDKVFSNMETSYLYQIEVSAKF